MKKRIALGKDYHAEPGETKHHQHDIYTTRDVGENKRIHVGTLSLDAVKAWATAART